MNTYMHAIAINEIKDNEFEGREGTQEGLEEGKRKTL